MHKVIDLNWWNTLIIFIDVKIILSLKSYGFRETNHHRSHHLKAIQHHENKCPVLNFNRNTVISKIFFDCFFSFEITDMVFPCFALFKDFCKKFTRFIFAYCDVCWCIKIGKFASWLYFALSLIPLSIKYCFGKIWCTSSIVVIGFENFEPSLNKESQLSLQEAAQNTQRYGLFTEEVSRSVQVLHSRMCLTKSFLLLQVIAKILFLWFGVNLNPLQILEMKYNGQSKCSLHTSAEHNSLPLFYRLKDLSTSVNKEYRQNPVWYLM